MKTIFLTGAGAFIGRNIYEQICDEYHVIAPRSYELDLIDLSAVRDFFSAQKIDVVVHCANCREGDIYKTNITIFENLVVCQNLYGKLITLGSGAEYDARHYIPFMKEEYLGNHIPEEPYGRYKYEIAHMLQQREAENIIGKPELQLKNQKNTIQHIIYEMKKEHRIVELILFGIYGKYEEYQRRFISNNICRNLKGLPMTISQNVYFDYLYIDDFVEILKWFIENKCAYVRYNVCTGKSVDLLTLAHTINEELGTESKILVAQKGWKLEYSGCNSRLLKEIGTFSFSDYKLGIQELCQYYRGVINNIEME